MFRGVVSLALVVVLAGVVEPPRPLAARHLGELRPLLLRQGASRSLVKPHLPLLIDLYWLRCLIGIAEPESAEKNRNLAQYGFFLTDLDPRFFHAHYYLALATPYSLGGDVYENGELAMELVERGISRFPEDFRLRLLKAFLLTYVRRDYKAATREFVAIAKLPNAPASAIAAASAMFIDEERFDEAISFISEALDRKGQSGLTLLSDRKKQLEIERLLRKLDAAVARAAGKLGRTPETLDEVIAAGEWPADLIKDPHGGDLSVQAGRGRSSWLVGRLWGTPSW
ncbi:MAG: hypothetical protein INH41_24705 [Myxococcaceae bacterium]|jgi:hypothetical protein|nr:hypothetical protein [Myxococcaceae bacterium]MCA3015603.1 hypothetical protein [Myxococcaceae bacterium]